MLENLLSELLRKIIKINNNIEYLIKYYILVDNYPDN